MPEKDEKYNIENDITKKNLLQKSKSKSKSKSNSKSKLSTI